MFVLPFFFCTAASTSLSTKIFMDETSGKTLILIAILTSYTCDLPMAPFALHFGIYTDKRTFKGVGSIQSSPRDVYIGLNLLCSELPTLTPAPPRSPQTQSETRRTLASLGSAVVPTSQASITSSFAHRLSLCVVYL